MQDKEIYKLLGKIEEAASNNTKAIASANETTRLAIQEVKRIHERGIDEIKHLLSDATKERKKQDASFDKRLKKVELVIGRITVKMAAAGIVFIAVIEKGISFIWERISG